MMREMMRACITSVVHETQMQTCSIWLHSDSYNCLIWTTSCPKSHRSHAPPMSNYDRLTEPEHYKSATGSEPAHSNQHVLNTRRQLTYNHPWHYSGGEMHCEWFKSTPAGTCACFYLLRQLWLGFPLKILPFPQFESRPIVSGNPAQHT